MRLLKETLGAHIQGLEKYSKKDIERIVYNFVINRIEDSSFDAYINKITIIGSRTKGTAKEDSDLDILLEYSGSEREDDMFNLLHEEPLLYIDNIKVDINPINSDKDSTEDWLKRDKNFKNKRIIKDD